MIPPTRYASPGVKSQMSCDKKRLPMDYVSEENMVAFSALPRWQLAAVPVGTGSTQDSRKQFTLGD